MALSPWLLVASQSILSRNWRQGTPVQKLSPTPQRWTAGQTKSAHRLFQASDSGRRIGRAQPAHQLTSVEATRQWPQEEHSPHRRRRNASVQLAKLKMRTATPLLFRGHLGYLTGVGAKSGKRRDMNTLITDEQQARAGVMVRAS